jgi:hypothetical protein
MSKDVLSGQVFTYHWDKCMEFLIRCKYFVRFFLYAFPQNFSFGVSHTLGEPTKIPLTA